MDGVGPKKRNYEETLTPLRTSSQRYGMNEREGLQKLLAANDFLERSPREAIMYFAKHYGVDLNNPNQQPVRPQVDPNVAALFQEVSTLKNTLQTREQQETEAEISRFAKDHPHLETVRAMMGNLMLTGQAIDMEDAYQKAIWATPEIRTQLIAEQQTANAPTARDKERERAEKAKRAAVSLNGSPGNGSGTAPASTFKDGRDAARAAMEQLGY